MSLLVVSAVRDQKVSAFGPPMFTRTKAEAVRMFLDACADGGSLLSKHPTDFQLYMIGSFDDQTGVLESANPLELLVTGGE